VRPEFKPENHKKEKENRNSIEVNENSYFKTEVQQFNKALTLPIPNN
jgi:hypothetical protein